VRDAEGLRLRMKPNIGGIPSTIAYAYETPGRIAGLGMSRLASDFAEAKGLLGPNRPIVPALGRLSFKLSQLGKGQSPDEDQ
jgi:hypothetical protein